MGEEVRVDGERLRAARRQPVRVSQESLVVEETLAGGGALPLVLRPRAAGLDAPAWAALNREFIESRLLEHGALLFRGFGLDAVEQFERLAETISGELLEYRERSSPRSQVSGNIYTSTDYPANQHIFLHNENSYQRAFPLKLYFYCSVAPQQGGETPIADCRRIYSRINPRIRERFVEKQWMYVRNFGDGFGLPWQTVFGTEDRAKVEEQCRLKGIRAEWKDGNRLRISTVLPVVARHPRTGELSWFNHATFFHVSTLEPAMREILLEEFSEYDLPTNTFYGDGSSIEPEVLDELRGIYREETVSFPWEQGDVMLLDNVLTAHGRAPYAGPRKILVAMAEPRSRDEV
jgi:alpha-ketoglutarate-dependent taurine dioxygenase